MENRICVELLKNKQEEWNNQRLIAGIDTPNFRNTNFSLEFHGESLYDLPEFFDLNFANSDMNMVSLRNCTFINCCFDGAHITFADLVDACFQSCTFKNVCMRVTKIGDAAFTNCLFENSDLSYCSAENTSFKGTKFVNTRMEHMSLVSSDFSDAYLDGCFVYGVSAWNLILQNTKQKDLLITHNGQPYLTVDDIELAQFIYLLINNNNLRTVINTITSKVVLILGNFSPKRKRVLDLIRNELRQHDLVPVIFDFEVPSAKNLTETVLVLASMSKCVIADLTSQKSIPHELANIIPYHPSLTICPIILNGERPYSMFDDYKVYPWVKPLFFYKEDDIHGLISHLIGLI